MRFMPIDIDNGRPDDLSIGVVQACMMYPDDQESIDEDIDIFRLRAARGWRDTASGRRFQADWRASQLGGMYAGAILFKMIVFDVHRPDLLISFNKATHAVSLEMYDVRQGLDRSLSTIKGYWGSHRNAAHLWAALLLTLERDGSQTPFNFVSVVSLAEQIAERASHLVEGWDPWRAPVSFPLDASELIIDAPSAEQVQHVISYRVGKK